MDHGCPTRFLIYTSKLNIQFITFNLTRMYPILVYRIIYCSILIFGDRISFKTFELGSLSITFLTKCMRIVCGDGFCGFSFARVRCRDCIFEALTVLVFLKRNSQQKIPHHGFIFSLERDILTVCLCLNVTRMTNYFLSFYLLDNFWLAVQRWRIINKIIA